MGSQQGNEPPFQNRKPEKDHEDRIRDLMCYLWDNYIQIFNNDAQIFLLGVGNAHYAVKALLTFRGEFRDPQDDKALNYPES